MFYLCAIDTLVYFKPVATPFFFWGGGGNVFMKGQKSKYLSKWLIFAIFSFWWEGTNGGTEPLTGVGQMLPCPSLVPPPFPTPDLDSLFTDLFLCTQCLFHFCHFSPLLQKSGSWGKMVIFPLWHFTAEKSFIKIHFCIMLVIKPMNLTKTENPNKEWKKKTN